ncbi:MAG TPA: VWA domain-containing protein, partial [Candidatus Nanopelagicales bacterium]|nr:VWA domain-containing protein [Candidatus Nanopelagicales bacterium]
PSRLEAAKRLAFDALRALPAGGRVSVVAAGATPRVVANATTDMGRVRAALAGISATPATADMGEALALASALAARAGDAEVLVATDAAFTAPKDLEVAAPVTVLQVGRERKNQALVAFAVRSAATAVTRSVFISVANMDLEPTTERVELWGDGRLLEARDLFLDPVSRADVGIDDVPLDVRVLEARLAGDDQLALDDRAWAVVPPDRLLRILLVSEGDPYLETALSFLPNAELYGVKPADYGAGTKPELFDLVIFDAALPATLPRVPTLAIAPPRTSPLGTVTGSLEDPALGRPAPDEPLLRYVDLTTLHVAQATRLSLPAWARTVVPTAAGDPLLYAGTRDGIATGVLAFEPRRSDLPLQVAFPILVSNLVGELVGASRAPTTAVAPGSLVSLPIPSGATGLRVTRPDGTTLDLAPAVTGGAAATFASTEQLGVYTVTPLGLAGGSPAPSGSPAGSPSASPSTTPAGSAAPSPLVVDPSAPVQFAVDLFDVGESTIAPGSATALERLGSAVASGGAGAAGNDRPPARDDLWIPLAAIALAFLVLEAVVFQRDALVRLRRWLGARLGRGGSPAPPTGSTLPRPGRPG